MGSNSFESDLNNWIEVDDIDDAISQVDKSQYQDMSGLTQGDISEFNRNAD